MPSIFAALGLSEVPTSTFRWHALILEGFDAAGIPRLASTMHVAESALNTVVFQGGRAVKKGTLSVGQSNIVYQIASTFESLCLKGLPPKEAGAWLAAENPSLKGRIPLDLLATAKGEEYVAVAIERL